MAHATTPPAGPQGRRATKGADDGRRGKRRGFSQRMSWGFSGATVAARRFSSTIFFDSNSLKESNFIPKLDSSLFQDVETVDNVAFQRSGINQRGCFHPCLTNNFICFLEPAQDPALFPDKVGPISPPRVECFHQINWVISNGVLWPFRKVQDWPCCWVNNPFPGNP